MMHISSYGFTSGSPLSAWAMTSVILWMMAAKGPCSSIGRFKSICWDECQKKIIQLKYYATCGIKLNYLHKFQSSFTASFLKLFKVEFLAFSLAQPVANAMASETLGIHGRTATKKNILQQPEKTGKSCVLCWCLVSKLNRK